MFASLSSQVRSSSVNNVAGDLAGCFHLSQESVDKDGDEADSDTGWDITIVDAIFRKYTVELGDQWRSVEEDSDHSTDSEVKPFLSDLSPQEAEESVTVSSQSMFKSPKVSFGNGQVVFETTSGNKLNMSENEYETSTYQQRTSMGRSVSSSYDSMSKGEDDSGLCAMVERVGDADSSVARETEDVTVGTEDVYESVEEGGHGGTVDSATLEQSETVHDKNHGKD